MFRYLIIFILTISISYGNDDIYIKTKDLKLIDLVNITSKAINKTIVLPAKFSGNINLIQNTSVNKNDLLDILTIVLEQNNYKLIKYNNILKVIKVDKIKRKKNSKRIYSYNKSSTSSKCKSIKYPKSVITNYK